MKVRVFAPATVANLASGFDVLGLALSSLGDQLTVERIEKREVIIESSIPTPADPQKNTAGRGLHALIHDKNLKFGFKVSIQKNIPLSSGLGGSAASAVGSVIGANALLDEKLNQSELLRYSIIGESANGSAHCDNIAPCLYGGVVAVLPGNRIFQIKKSLPDLKILVLHQDVRIDTSSSRKKLNPSVPLEGLVEQTKSLMSLILGLQTEDKALIALGLRDSIIEAQRRDQIPNFQEIKNTFAKFSLGGSISGSGPSMFFVFENNNLPLIESLAQRLARKYSLNVYYQDVCPLGARVERSWNL